MCLLSNTLDLKHELNRMKLLKIIYGFAIQKLNVKFTAKIMHACVKLIDIYWWKNIFYPPYNIHVLLRQIQKFCTNQVRPKPLLFQWK